MFDNFIQMKTVFQSAKATLVVARSNENLQCSVRQ